MTHSPQDKQWREMCEAILGEPDSSKLLDLVKMLNRVLDERESEVRKRNRRPELPNPESLAGESE